MESFHIMLVWGRLPYPILLIKDKDEILDKRGFEILSGLAGMTTGERITYAEEFLGIETLPYPITNNRVQIRKDLQGPQDCTIDHTCGHCGKAVAGIVVAKHTGMFAQWLACPSCKRGSVLNYGIITPTPLLGEDIKGLESPIKDAYLEARKSISSKSYTACVLMCRKILMNVAVEKGASQGESFMEYIDYMIKTGHITVTMKEWVNKIRNNGNVATHEIPSPNSEKANTTLAFTALLLKNVYETKYRMDLDSAHS